jgi:hypothetical protein
MLGNKQIWMAGRRVVLTAGDGNSRSPYSPGASEARVRALLNRFEGRPEVEPEPEPKRDRVVSALDAPRAAVEGAAATERDLARARLDALNPAVQAGTAAFLPPRVTRNVPTIGPGDSDTVVALKREILAKESEIQSVAGKMVEVSGKLDRIIGMLQVAEMPIVADDTAYTPPLPKVQNLNLKSMPSDDASSNMPPQSESRSVRGRSTPAMPSTPASVTGNTLAEILAAARGGDSSTRAKSEKPKYAAFLKDLQ